MGWKGWGARLLSPHQGLYATQLKIILQIRGLSLENRLFSPHPQTSLLGPNQAQGYYFWQYSNNNGRYAHWCWSDLYMEQPFIVDKWWAGLRFYPYRYPHCWNEALGWSRVPVLRISLPQGNPGCLKELQLQSYLSLSHSRTCPWENLAPCWGFTARKWNESLHWICAPGYPGEKGEREGIFHF